MTRTPTHDPVESELLERAYRLAYFICPDSPLALQIAAEALRKLDVVATAQDKRRYYTLRGRRRGGSRPLRRNKVSLSKLHLLQCLVYHESERCPARHEEEEMIRRFVMHLVKITQLRNSFYVTLGICQLLHDYSTGETMAVYERLVEEPDHFKEDFYYRSRKRRLLEEICRRFEQQVAVCRGRRREKRLETHPESGRFRALVRACLEQFTPWDTACPESFRAHGDSPLFGSAGSHPDDEHLVEVRRMHAVLHPGCFARLTRALGLEAPESRLAVPRFLTAMNGGGGTNGRDSAPPLDDEQRQEALSALAAAREQRRNLSPGLLRVLVDGREMGEIDLRISDRIRFEAPQGARAVEVRSPGGVVLALLMFASLEEGSPLPRYHSVSLEGGQLISFVVRPGDETPVTVVEVAYRETRLAAVAVLTWRRLSHRLSGAFAGSRLTVRLAVLVFTLGATLFVAERTRRTVLSPPPTLPPVDDLVRGPESAPKRAISLAEVRRIHIGKLGDAPNLRALRRSLGVELADSFALELSEGLSEADAVLKPDRSGPPGILTLQLVNRAGEVLWRRTCRQVDDELAPKLVRELEQEIRKSYP